MRSAVRKQLDDFMDGLRRRNPGEPEFHQAVQEVMESLIPFVNEHPRYAEESLLERLTEPDRIVIFRVCWEDDDGNVRANRAWRVQFNKSIGPYKGGLRFDKDLTLSILKFLGFEQVFKNSLTGLPMGGAKGGANFNPKGKSDREVMRFCQSLMLELHRHIGEHTDVPAGDIGVGSREISYLFGQYVRIENRFAGVLTGKDLAFGGSSVRKEATGYGCACFCENVLERRGESLAGKSVAVSGSGNVAVYAVEKALELRAKVLTMSDSGGTVHFPDGIDEAQLTWIKELKERRRGRIEEAAEKFGLEFHRDARPWSIPCDVAFPCATQNELSLEDAKALIRNGVQVVCEGANMPTELAAVRALCEAGVALAPSKAANAGGVAVSGLEQSQNALRLSWTREEVDLRLKAIMRDVHERCVQHGGGGAAGRTDYVRGANVAGFLKVADAMLACGIV